MKFSPTTATILYLLSLSIYNKANAQPQQAEAAIDSLMHRYEMPGLSVAVVKQGHIIYIHAFALRNIATGSPLTDSSIFRIASISKSFSATAIMQLVEAKKLALNDDASKLIGILATI